MKLARRLFLKGVAAAIGITAITPVVVKAGTPVYPPYAKHPVAIASGVIIDTGKKEIRVLRRMTVQELYTIVSDAFDEIDLMPYAIPMLGITKNYVRMENGWTISDDSWPNLRHGTVYVPTEQAYYSGIYTTRVREGKPTKIRPFDT